MARSEFVEAVHGSRGVRRKVEIYAERVEDARIGDPDLGYQARCQCGAQEQGFAERGSAVKWAEHHLDGHGDDLIV